MHRKTIVAEAHSALILAISLENISLKSFFGLNILTLQHSLQIKNRGKLNKINAFSSFWQQNVFTEIQICKLEVHIILAILIRDVCRTQLSIYDEAF